MKTDAKNVSALCRAYDLGKAEGLRVAKEKYLDADAYNEGIVDGRESAIEDAIKKLAESEDTILTDKQYYTLMEMKEQNMDREAMLRECVTPNEEVFEMCDKHYKDGFSEGYQQGRAEMQEFVEKRCKDLGIDYTLIFTCESVD